ncbi:MAG: hypothetical protein GXY07_15520 [Candidatus Hydrogenedentes bacterium]|nr:hypothetical protein [Candidatus Hydrogenedentota bacterium]
MSDNHESAPGPDILMQALIKMATESWRFARVIERLLIRTETNEQARCHSQYRWFIKRIEDSLSDAGLHIVNVEGHSYEQGMAVTPLNIEEFEVEDLLMVDQMLEPIIVGDNGVVKTGTVMLRKLEQ